MRWMARLECVVHGKAIDGGEEKIAAHPTLTEARLERKGRER